MRKISDLSEQGKENLLDKLRTIFEDIGLGLDKGESFIQNALVHVSDRWEISEKDLYEFYMGYFNGESRKNSSIFDDEQLGD
ncbi:MAG TPA: hypothetical protein DCP62_00115 [Erysipelotrichaceae bacterium]|nr:hypothetical protein [Erysipelotrichaceae bacterium]